MLLTGRVTVINRHRQCFWIRTNDARVYFAHRDHLQDGVATFEKLRVGDWMTFEEFPTSGQKRRATNLTHRPSWRVTAEELPAITTSTSSL